MNIERVQLHGKRYYKVEGEGTFASVTTILKHTKDQTGLDKWRKRIGEAAADKIGVDAAGRGTVMHKLLEIYLNHLDIKDKDERLSKTLELSKTDEEILPFPKEQQDMGLQLFYQIYNSSNYLQTIKKVYLQEVFLWMNQGIHKYAGTVDNASYLIDNSFKIIDFKTSSKPKEEKYITDYKLQTSAYSIAIWKKYGIRPDGAEIWISNELGGVQKFVLTFDEIKKYYAKFTDRLNFFYQMYPPISDI